MFKKKKSKLQLAQEEAQNAISKTNEKIEELGDKTSILYDELTEIQSMFDCIRNVPSDKRLKYEELKKVRLNWKQQAEKIEKDYKEAAVKNVGAGAAGAGVGVAVVTMGPTVAMGVATTFGVASTGTAISTLSGAAATKSALAWLGGGGMAAGEAFLALAGPIGWAIAGVALLASGLMFWKTKTDKGNIEAVFTSISQRDVKSYDLAIVELNERISRIVDESGKLKDAIREIKTFGRDYNAMTEEQQYKLGAYVNLMYSSTQLLVNPIKGIQPKYTSEDLGQFIEWNDKKADTDACSKYDTPLHDGDAVITPAFKMKNAKAIIHAVGPNFAVTPKAFKELFDAYYNSLVVLKENGYHSISFPLISSGIFGGNLEHPVAESAKQCMMAYKKFTEDYPDYDVDVKLCAFIDAEMQEAMEEYEKRK